MLYLATNRCQKCIFIGSKCVPTYSFVAWIHCRHGLDQCAATQNIHRTTVHCSDTILCVAHILCSLCATLKLWISKKNHDFPIGGEFHLRIWAISIVYIQNVLFCIVNSAVAGWIFRKYKAEINISSFNVHIQKPLKHFKLNSDTYTYIYMYSEAEQRYSHGVRWSNMQNWTTRNLGKQLIPWSSRWTENVVC